MADNNPDKDLTFDAKAHISFDTVSNLIKGSTLIYYNPDNETLPEADRQKVIKAMEEIASTPEGNELMQQAFLRDEGHINVAHSPNGYILSVSPNTVLLGEEHTGAQYNGVDGNMHDFSIQRILVHELYHLANDHHLLPKEDRPEAEIQNIQFTNKFMEGYYKEPERKEDHSGFNKKGTDEWDFNSDFKAEGYNNTNEENLDLGQSGGTTIKLATLS